MIDRTRRNTNNEARLLDIEGLCAYINVGKTNAIKFAKEAGAAKRIGRRCLYDVQKLDEAIDNLPTQAEA